MDWAEIGKWALGAIAVLAGVGFAFKMVFVRKSTSTNSERTVVQTNNKAGRDIVGGDSINNSRR